MPRLRSVTASFWTSALWAGAAIFLVFTTQNAALAALPDYAAWKAACDKLPANRVLQGRVAPRNFLPLKSFAQFEEALDQFFALATNGTLSVSSNWVGTIPPKETFFNTQLVYHLDRGQPFLPFAQKLQVPEGSEVIFHGDLHGDVRSLMVAIDQLNHQGYLDGFKLVRTNNYMVFLGDYTDRGMYGIEVLYTLLRLKIANPTHVYFARGNHEDISLISRYGFLAECEAKFGDSLNLRKLTRFYDFLPVVIYTGSGTNFLQCNHGGMEPGYNAARLLDAPGAVRYQLLGEISQKGFARVHPEIVSRLDKESANHASRLWMEFTPESPTVPSLIGFMWNDFSLVRGQIQLGWDPGRGFIYGDMLTRSVLQASSGKSNKLRGVFRAHQHSPMPNPMMTRLLEGKGVFRHWQATDSLDAMDAVASKLTIERGPERPLVDGAVWTFNVVCDSVYGSGLGFSFDTMGILKTAPQFEDWRLKVVNSDVTH